MGGLALGAWAAGRAADRRATTLAMYAGLELFIAATAIALPAVLASFDPLLVRAYADGTAPVSFAIARIAVSFLLIGVPAAAMGATYPIAVAWLARIESTGARIPQSITTAAGALYAANSAGAAAGAMAAGFWLTELLGIRGTTWVAVALNAVAAGLALWFGRASADLTSLRQGYGGRPELQRRRKVGTTDGHVGTTYGQGRPGAATRGRRSKPPDRISNKPQPTLAAVAAALSGLAALVYEVAWTRLIALVLGPTTYAFATMAAAFITGIAFGSTLGVRLARRSTRAAFWLAVMLAVTSVTTIVAAWFTASYLPLAVARTVATYTDFGSLFVREAVAILLVLLPASVSLGATFTLALATASTAADSSARQTARVYTANTLGAVAGALAAGFLLVPAFGLQSTFLYTSVVLLVAASGIIAISDRGRPGQPPHHGGSRRAGLQASLAAPRAHWHSNGRAAVGILAGSVIAIVMFSIPEWDRDLITSGAYKYARQLSTENLDAILRAGTLEYYGEGAAGTVSVRRVAGSRALAIDGKVDASNAGDMLTQRLLGLLPALLHPQPRDALVIGLGSGVTADAVLASGEIQHLDIVEISPEVVEASAYFERENHGVLKNPAVRLLIADGRSHLRLSTRQYDVIVSEPSNPWMAGVAALFTHEFFEAARARLRPGGMFCQWAHTYEIAEEDLRSIVRTFASVFPDGTMWLVGDADLLLIGSAAARVEPRLPELDERSRKGSVPALLADVGVPLSAAPFVLLSLFSGGANELAAFGEGARLQTDDRMSLEFSAARAMYAPPEGNAGGLKALATSAAPAVVAERVQSAGAADWMARGNAALQARAFGMAHESFRRTLALDSRSAIALRGSSDAAAQERTLLQEIEWLKMMARDESDNAPVRVELSHVLATLGKTEEAIAAARDAVRIDPARPEPMEQLASIIADAGDGVRLTPIADELVKRFPSREDGRYYQAAAAFLAGRATDVESPIRALLTANPNHAKGQNLLGVVCGSLGKHECAQAAFAAALTLNPRDPSVYVNLGYLRLARGDQQAAAGFFAEALAIDPATEAATRGLAELRGYPF